MGNRRSGALIEQAVISTDPASPPAGFAVLYAKSDGKWYVKDSEGTITQLTNVPGGGAVTGGQATISFATFLPEAEIVVTGQSGVTTASFIQATIYADNDDVYAQNWDAPVIRNIINSTGFTITLRPAIGQFKGNVKVNWLY